MSDTLRSEIEKEIAEHTILIYGKGTKEMPRCGFTLETVEFFNRFPYPFTVVDVLENMPKRNELSHMTDWQTLPKVFINGTFYGDTDILGPMDENGELLTVLKNAFPGAAPQKRPDADVIKLH
jgi:monothiol glutaredoxin